MVRVKCLATLYLLMILPARSPIFPASAARSRPRRPSTLALTLASSTSVAANSSVRLRARSAATAVLELHGGSLLPAGEIGLLTRWREGQTAGQLRADLQPGRAPSRGVRT